MSEKIKLWYSFGNHMHWVDMQWLWGYHVMPGSTFDMLNFCRETGAKGNVNFDGIGYEKMAAEAPEALQALREAVQSGLIEPVGCSYGQPYGLFHGGESNIRQRIYGVRTVMRLLGVRPKTFWEEEFDFFPQLPQMLRGCGFENASLYFQWTWHTPEVPFEESPVIWWEGIDGSKLLTATRNRLNLHQWPEDFQILLDELAEAGPHEVLRRGVLKQKGEAIPPLDPKPRALSRWEGEGGPPAPTDEHPEENDIVPLVLQWLELMPSPDWMCRSELMIPKLRELLDDPRFEVQFGTLKEYLAESRKAAEIPTRQYGMDEVWHGLSLGKNGDRFRRMSRESESMLLAAESQSATFSLFGRPYCHWDVYPVWELEEGWRKLLMAQHHDNDECEGLCGHVGEVHYDTARDHAGAVLDANERFLDAFEHGEELSLPITGTGSLAQGWDMETQGSPQTWEIQGDEVVGTCGDLKIRASAHDPLILSVGGMRFDMPLDLSFDRTNFTLEVKRTGVRYLSEDNRRYVRLSFNQAKNGLHVRVGGEFECAQPGFQGAISLKLPLPGVKKVLADTAYAVEEVKAVGSWPRKYPEGDWMTSPQWFEQIENPFVARTFVDFELEDIHLQVIHDRTRQWLRKDDEFSCVINLRDPWDESNYKSDEDFEMEFIPHDGHAPAELWERSQRRWHALDLRWISGERSRPIPNRFNALCTLNPNVLPTAFYREAEDFASRGLESYAGRGMGYPFIVRLVEFDAEPADAVLRVAGTVAKAFRTNLMGEIEEELPVEVKEDQPEWQSLYRDAEPGEETMPNLGGKYSLIRFPMKAREIATLYLDIEEGRKQPRDLDAHRHIWATVHRTEDEKAQS